MCGFLIQQRSVKNKSDDEEFKAALSMLRHRGPDAQNQTLIECSNSLLRIGHTRLSIIELTEQSNQPMMSLCGRYIIVFNGEIYNYLELIELLDKPIREKIVYGDTSVLVNLWSKMQEKCLSKLVGMFSFVIFDKYEETLKLVTDGFGIKPMYYHKSEFVVSSEIQPINRLIKSKLSVAKDIEQQYILTGEYDKNLRTFYQDINRLPPGHLLKYCLKKSKVIDTLRWWYPCTKPNQFSNVHDFCDALRTEFLESVKIHLRSDVPVGFALSGGLDSSSLVAAARHLNPKMDINAISYIPNDQNLSEEKWIDHIADEKNINVHKVRITSAQFIKDLPNLISSQGEPFGSSSIYAQYAVFRSAHKLGFKVMIEGQGADELLAGYLGYPHAFIIESLVNLRPLKALKYINNVAVEHKMSRRVLLSTVFGRLISSSSRYFTKVKLTNRKFAFFDEIYDRPFDTFETNMNLKSYFKDELRSSLIGGSGLIHLLRHSDRNSMTWSVESRVPFLNPRLAMLTLGANTEYLSDGSAQTKMALRKAFADFLPMQIVNRSDKVGFETPEKNWLVDNADTIKALIKKCDQLEGINIGNLNKYVKSSLEGSIPYNWMTWRILNLMVWRTTNEI